MREDPLNKLVEEVTKLLNVLEKGELIPLEEWPPGVDKELANIEKLSHLISEPSEKIIKEMEKTPSKEYEISDQLPESRKRVLKKMDEIRKEAEKKHAQTSKEIARRKKEEKEIGKKGKESQTRKKKFNRLGTKKNWKPL